MRVLAAAAVLVLAAGSAPAVVPPATVTARASSGQVYEGFLMAPGELHSFLLEDLYPMTYSVSLKAGKGSALLPDIALYDASETDITASLAPFRRDAAKSVAVKNAPAFATSGRHVLQVKGKAGSTGSYLLKVTAKVVKSFKGTGFVTSPDATSFDVFAPTESLVKVKVVKGAGSVLVPELLSVDGPSCAVTSLVLSATPGLATFTAPLTGDWAVALGGDGGTGGAFVWSAKVKPAKPSKKPVRVNGGSPYFAGPGPAGGTLTASVGQDVAGFAVDALDLCWREVRTKGGGPKIGKNTVQCTTIKGLNPRTLAADFATDAAPPPRTFALGSSSAAALAAGELFQIPRDGSPEVSLDTGLAAILRVLADGTAAYVMDVDGIVSYPYAGGGPDNVAGSGPGSGGGVYKDMAHGGLGLVFALVNGGGDLEVRTAPVTGGAPTPLATLSPDPGFQALASRGPDAYLAVDNGTGGSSLYRVSTCFPGAAVPLCPDFSGPVRAMAADDQNVYAIEDDASDGIRLRQIPRGGGESLVLFRGPDAAFTISADGVAAAGGYVYVLADDGGGYDFYRVKRR